MNCFDFSIMPRRLTDKTPHSLACHTFAQNLNSTIMARGYKTGGRKTGTPNKTTGLTKEMINQVLAAYHDDANPKCLDAMTSHWTCMAGDN